MGSTSLAAICLATEALIVHNRSLRSAGLPAQLHRLGTGLRPTEKRWPRAQSPVDVRRADDTGEHVKIGYRRALPG
jgi:hypothetical protein